MWPFRRNTIVEDELAEIAGALRDLRAMLIEPAASKYSGHDRLDIIKNIALAIYSKVEKMDAITTALNNLTQAITALESRITGGLSAAQATEVATKIQAAADSIASISPAPTT